MIEFRGRVVPTRLEELVDPRHTAILLVDVQNDFCVRSGVAQRHGKYLLKWEEVSKKLKEVANEGRKAGAKIVYLQNTMLPNHMGDSPARLRYLMRSYDVKDPSLIPEHTLEGSWGQQIVDDMRPEDKDLVVKKYRQSGFVGTNLDMMLRANEVKTLLIAGVVAEGCVEATARDGQYYDYFVVILRDCVDSAYEALRDAALKVMERNFDVATSDQIIEIWKKKRS